MRLILTSLLLLSLQLSKAQSFQVFDSIVQKAIDETSFEGIVVLANKGEIIFQKAQGYKDANRESVLSVNDPMRIASISKLFTVVVIMQLVESGQLKVDDKLMEVIPDFPCKKCSKITIGDLMLHTSGMPKEDDKLFRSQLSPLQMIEQTLNEKKLNKYGKFSYSNLDYLALSLVIEKITGISAKQNIQERIIDRLELTDTGFDSYDLSKPKIAQGFVLNEENFQPEPDYYIENFDVAAGMYSNAQDLLTFEQALYTDKLLNDESRENMYNSNPGLGYVAFGTWVFSYPYADKMPLLMERRGGLLGFQHSIVRFLDANKTVIILCNNGTFNSDTFGQVDSLKEALIIALNKL